MKSRLTISVLMVIAVSLFAFPVTNANADPGVVLALTQGSHTTEDGGAITLQVKLNTEPAADVTIPVVSSDTTEGTVSVSSFTFTPINWNGYQSVTVTGVDDDERDGKQLYTVLLGPCVSDDTNYDGQYPVTFPIANIDNDTPGVTVEPVIGLLTSEDGKQQATFTVKLNNPPTADVIIAVTSSDPSEGAVSPSSITFTPTNWSGLQTVTVTGVDDDVVDGNQTYTVELAGAQSSDTGYNGLKPDDVSVINIDNDVAGVTVGKISGNTTEDGGQATFTMSLISEPTADVIIAVSSSDTSEGTVSPASLTFTPTNWSGIQTVTITGVDDDIVDGNQSYTIVLGSASSSDSNYSGFEIDDIEMINMDVGDTAGFAVSEISDNTAEDGKTATFTVKLTSEPVADVTIDVSSSDESEGTVSPASLTFTSTNWNGLQTVTVTGVDDAVVDGHQSYTVALSEAVSSDGNYNGMNPLDVSVINIDDDTAGVTLSDISGDTTEEGKTATFTVNLRSEPTADVTIDVSSSDESEGTVSPASLTFTSTNWSGLQTVTVTGVDDAVDDGDQSYTVVLAEAVSSDGNYNGKVNPPDVAVINIDDDSAGITVGDISGNTTEKGDTATFVVKLHSQPTADVTIDVTSSDTSEGTVSPSVLTFTPDNWNGLHTVTVTGVNDDVVDGNQSYTVALAAVVSGDNGYSGLDPDDVPVINIDNDIPGFTVGDISGGTTEKGEQAEFTVRLLSQPEADVIISVSSSDTSEGTVSPSVLTFTPDNWNGLHTVTVTGVDDDIVDGCQSYTVLLDMAASDDDNYNGINPPDVAVINADDDIPGFTVSPISGDTTEEGGQATFAVRLISEPVANVTVAVSSSDTSEGTVSSSTLTFTSADWNAADHVVTVTGVNDDIADGNQIYTVVLAAAASSDVNYNGMNPDDVSVINIDNNEAGFTVGEISGETTEMGGTATFTVSLISQPTADVIIDVSSSDTSEGKVSPASLTFTPTNWDGLHAVTVTGADDAMVDGNQGYTILLAPAVSANSSYNGLDPADVSVVNIDDDTAEFTVAAISGNTTEEGGQATFAITLNSQPAADVTVNVSSSDTSEGTVSPSSLTFTPADWSSSDHIVTVTGEDDAIADGSQSYTIILSPATSSDGNYSGLDPDDVSVINTDDDRAGFIVGPLSGDTSEDETTAMFTVRLSSEPTADVTLCASSSDETEGIVSPLCLTFTPDNWNAMQSVTVIGVNDDIADGHQSYTVIMDPGVSSDSGYEGREPDGISVVNEDNDVAGFDVSPLSGDTTEGGEEASFTVKLKSQPTADVTIAISSSDTSEGTVSPSELVFTGTNWSGAQTVTVTGVNDDMDDGNQTYAVVLAPAVSSDSGYDTLKPGNVCVTNIDDDKAGLIAGLLNGNTSEDEDQATFTVKLRSQPEANVTIGLSSSDVGEGKVSPASLTFTDGNWDDLQTVTMTGVDDDVVNFVDGDQTYTIVIAPASSTDGNYDGLDLPDIQVINLDKDTLFAPTELEAQAGIGSVRLTWISSISPYLEGYNVYRSESENGSYELITDSPVKGNSYTDKSDFTGGITYYYYLKAEDDLGNESAESNKAWAEPGLLKLFIPDSRGKSGEQVRLPVNIANADDLSMCSVDILVTYDSSVLSATDIEKAALTAGYGWAKNLNEAGVAREHRYL